MLSRRDISDAHRDRAKDLLPGQAGGHGGAGNDTRLLLDAVRHSAETGVAWADPPTCYGGPNRLWRPYNRGCRNGVWGRVAAALRDDDTGRVSVDGSCARATGAAAGARDKRTAPAASRPGRWGAAAGGSGRGFTPPPAPSATPSCSN